MGVFLPHTPAVHTLYRPFLVISLISVVSQSFQKTSRGELSTSEGWVGDGLV